MVIRNQTKLLDTFIELLDDEVNNLKHNHIRDILIEDLGDDIPESEDNINENYKA